MTAPATAAPKRPPVPAAHARIIRKVATAQRRIDAAAQAAAKYGDVRMDAMIEGRQLSPPVPWIRLAEAAGVSDAYVIREVPKAMRARGLID